MPENAKSTRAPAREPILTETEVASRMLLLATLQGALADLGTRCVLARNQRLVLRYNTSPCPPSGLTDPKLFIFGPHGTDTAVTDGTAYHLASGPDYPAADPAAAAVAIHRSQHLPQEA